MTPVALQTVIDAPELPSALTDAAYATARQKALQGLDDSYKRTLLTTCAVEIERYVGRMLWRGPSATPARRSTATIEVAANGIYGEGNENIGGPWWDPAVDACPRLPDVSGVDVSVESVRLWDEAANSGAGAYATPPSGYKLRPAGRILLSDRGYYEIVADLTAPTTPEPAAIEAMARLWAYRVTLRPGDLADVGGEQQVLAGAIMKSGAAEILRTIRERAVI